MHLHGWNGLWIYQRIASKSCHIQVALFVKKEVELVLNIFPRNNGHFSVVTRQVGDHPKGFQPAFCDLAGFSNRANHNACYGDVPAPENQLLQECSKIPVRMTEKSITLLKNFICLYSRLNVTVIDSFAGTCTTAIAAVKCGSHAIVIKEDPVCYRLAVSRLEKIASIIRKKTLTSLSTSSVVATLCGKRIHPTTATSEQVGIDDDCESNCTNGVRWHQTETIVPWESDSCPSL